MAVLVKTTKTAVFREATWHGSKSVEHLWMANTAQRSPSYSRGP